MILLSVCPSVTVSVTKCIVALKVDVGVESCSVVFLRGRFLFTSPDSFAVGSATTHSEIPNRQNFGFWISHGQLGHVNMAISEFSDAAFSAVRCCIYSVRRIRSTIGLLSDIYASCLFLFYRVCRPTSVVCLSF